MQTLTTDAETEALSRSATVLVEIVDIEVGFCLLLLLEGDFRIDEDDAVIGGDGDGIVPEDTEGAEGRPPLDAAADGT